MPVGRVLNPIRTLVIAAVKTTLAANVLAAKTLFCIAGVRVMTASRSVAVCPLRATTICGSNVIVASSFLLRKYARTWAGIKVIDAEIARAYVFRCDHCGKTDIPAASVRYAWRNLAWVPVKTTFAANVFARKAVLDIPGVKTTVAASALPPDRRRVIEGVMTGVAGRESPRSFFTPWAVMKTTVTGCGLPNALPWVIVGVTLIPAASAARLMSLCIAGTSEREAANVLAPWTNLPIVGVNVIGRAIPRSFPVFTPAVKANVIPAASVLEAPRAVVSPVVKTTFAGRLSTSRSFLVNAAVNVAVTAFVRTAESFRE